jgi:hypothetical protein
MEQINADLAYQALYAPELGLAQNAQYYEAPSQAQLGYIQSLGGGTPTAEREDTFSYTAPDPPYVLKRSHLFIGINLAMTPHRKILNTGRRSMR